jgi:TPR repeat protein
MGFIIRSVNWYTKSAKQGHAPAQINLGVMYANGQGVLQDYVMAHMYWNIAAVSGHKSAIKNRGIVEKNMTSSQLAESQELAREWMRKHQ